MFSKAGHILAVLLLGLVVSACDKTEPFRGTNIAAIDTSESSREQIGFYQTAVRETGMNADLESQFIVFRFDSSPAEIHSGQPPQSMEKATEIVNKVLEHQSRTPGTNLAKLFAAIDKRVKGLPQPIRVTVYTDCGIENMSAEDKGKVTAIVQRWHDDSLVESLTFSGLRDDYKLQIREIIAQPEPFFRIADFGH